MVSLWMFSAFAGAHSLAQAEDTEFDWAKRFTQAGNPVEFFRNDELHTTLPLPPASYPEQLQGMIWMDQAGYYGHSDVPSAMAAPDGVFTFGDDEFKLTGGNGRYHIKVDTHGPAWQWFNSAKGYVFYNMLSRQGFTYKFIFSDNFNKGQIIPSSELVLGSIEVPPSMVNFEFDYQSLYLDEKACPKQITEEVRACLGIDKTDEHCTEVKKGVTKCAKWVRPSSVNGGEKRNYYAYEIVDRNGQPREPYWSLYLEYVKSQADPSVTAAQYSLTGIDEFNFKADPEMTFRGIRPEPLKHTGQECEGAWECENKVCNAGLKFWEASECQRPGFIH